APMSGTPSGPSPANFLPTKMAHTPAACRFAAARAIIAARRPAVARQRHRERHPDGGALRQSGDRRGRPMSGQGLSGRLTQYGDRDFAAFLRRSFARSMGLGDEALGRPVVGIVDTSSDFNNCHRALPELIAAVERGVWQAGGLPRRFPVLSLGEGFLQPSAMMFRNLMALAAQAVLTPPPLHPARLARRLP